jgi:hypothetical protein
MQVDGVRRGYGSLTRTIGSHKIDLSTRHLYYATEPGTLIEVHAYSFTEHGAHDIRLSVSDIMLDLGREKVRPLEGLRENPFMQIHWRCGGKFTETSNLNVCGPAVLTFPKEISRSQAFTLHLGKLQIDGKAYDVPDIKYCYIPPTSKWVKFHG